MSLERTKSAQRASRKPEDRGKVPNTPWYQQPEEKIAAALYAWALGTEYYCYRRRMRNTTLYRMATGEDPPLTLGMWMSKKVANTVAGYGSNYNFPRRNVIYSACDTLENRLGTTRPFVQTTPRETSFKVRSLCRDVDAFLDGQFTSLKIYDLTRMIFRDAFIWGMGFLKVTADENGKDIIAERVMPDEILVDELATVVAPPRFMAQRRYVSRYDAMAAWGDLSADIARAIRMAPSAFIGVSNASSSCDMICLLEGWKLPDADGGGGLHCLTVANTCITYEGWKHNRFPFAIARWSPQTMGFWSTGGAFAMSPAQNEINVKWEQILDAQRAVAYPRWLAQKGTGVTAKSMGARPGAVHFFTGEKPTAIVPLAANAEMYQDAANWENFAYSLVGLTQQQAQGSKQGGINSGTAIRLMVDVEDQRNKSRLIMLEDLVTEVADLILLAAEETSPRVVVGDRTLSWAEITKKITRNKYNVKAFPVSGLPSTPEGKEQQISEWYADGVIDRRAYFRLQQMPDVVQFARLTTATDDLVEDTLDRIVEHEEFYAPEPTYDDFSAVIEQTKARYNLERRMNTPEAAMMALQQFITKVDEMKPSAPAVAGPGGPMPPSAATGPGAPIAPPPVQVQPSIQ